MALLRKINQVLLVLLVLTVCVLLHSKLLRPSSQHKLSDHRKGADNTARAAAVKPSEPDNFVPIIICASEERMGATMATINSVYSNTDARVIFYIVTLRDSVKLTRQYIQKTKLKAINYKILEFNPMVLRGKVKPATSRPDLLHPLNFVRFYLPMLDINHKRVIYLDDDVIVQGDISNLFHVRLKPGHAAAFSTDCDLSTTHEIVRSVGMQTTYMGFLDYRKQEVKDLGINPGECSFNPGVFVADMSEWRKQKITKQLEKWMEENFRHNIYSSTMAGGVATPPMLIVFHDKYTTLDPLWHIRHLGWSPDVHYSKDVLKEALLLHWNGPYKPWSHPAVHTDLWIKWFIPDPSGTFSMFLR
ncbi:glycosyltransferase 8 domain-containing protein 2 isoform X2 [Thalassophryne amazonica]|uniref:glycosyltransferase 8 domain-containing protein 2 isoform X2 n=1 Tax=Thalassophryne amazonica TaxID=390379 RepID=UPI00147134E4|nr:glycosyltransferase 8 domain-containing protein 2 isoform X2 [Thalassophryne amazonica]XP_034018912.1 glycosyltransferase 8 domain-containing protein 2 isoform X2 [Thalassophryne amazonica]